MTNDGGAGEVAENMEQEQEKGYRGEVPDKTPNSAYTVKGVTSGKSTPESDDDGENED